MIVEIIDGKVVGYLTPEEVAKKLGAKPQTIRQLINRGKIETLKIGWQHFIKEGTEIKICEKKIKRC